MTMPYGENLPFEAKGWIWERIYKGQFLQVKTYYEIGKMIAKAIISGHISLNKEYWDNDTPACQYCEQCMELLQFLVDEKLGAYEYEEVA